MAFTKMAQTERKISEARALELSMLERGWFETTVPVRMLEDLSIDHEPIDGGSRYMPGAYVYAPVWVHGVWLRVWADDIVSARWDIVKILLVATRDDPREREIVSTELILDLGVPRAVRESARNYVDLLKAREREELVNDYPTAHQ